MRTNIPEKLLEIVQLIQDKGQANQTRLTVLKKWFRQHPGRLMAFAIWVASRAVSRKGKTVGEAAELFKQARQLLKVLDKFQPTLDRERTEALLRQLRAFQNEYEQQRWGPVRIIKNWNLLLIEKAFEIGLYYSNDPDRGYKLASDYVVHYDPRYGTNLNGPSVAKLSEMIRFMYAIEAFEEENEFET